MSFQTFNSNRIQLTPPSAARYYNSDVRVFRPDGTLKEVLDGITGKPLPKRKGKRNGHRA